MNSNSFFKKFAACAMVGTAAFTLIGCGGSSSSTTTPAPVAKALVKLAPVKGPFKKATIKAYGLKNNAQPVSLTLNTKTPFSATNHEAEVELNETDLTSYGRIVFSFTNVETEGDTKANGIKSDPLELDSFVFSAPAGAGVANTTLSADIFDHLGTVAALQKSGVTTENIKSGNVITTTEIEESEFTAEETEAKNKILTVVSGQKFSDASALTENNRKALAGIMVAGIMEAAAAGSSLTTDAFSAHFTNLTTSLAVADDSSIATLLTTDNGGFVKPLDAAKANVVATNVLGDDTFTTSSVYDAVKATEAIEFSDTDFYLKLENFVPTTDANYYRIVVLFDPSASMTVNLLHETDGSFKKLPASLDDKKTVKSQVLATYTTDTIKLSTLSAGSSVKATHAKRITVYSSLDTFAISTDSNEKLVATTFSELTLPTFASTAKVQLTTPTNDSGSINLTSSYGAWLATDSNLRTAESTGLYSYGVQYYLKDSSGYWRLGCDSSDTGGHDGFVNSYIGQDFVYNPGVTRYIPKVSDLSKTDAKMYLVPSIYSVENPRLMEAVAFASLEMKDATTTEASSWTSVPLSGRLTARVAWDSENKTLRVTAPKLYSFAEHDMPTITLKDYQGVRRNVDAGLRYGWYGLAIQADNMPTEIIHQSGAASENNLMYGLFFSVDKNGDVWSHGGMGETTVEFLKYRPIKLVGNTTSGFALPVTSSTFGYFFDRIREDNDYQGQIIADANVSHFSTDSAAQSAFASYMTTNVGVYLLGMTKSTWSDPTVMNYNVLAEVDNQKIESSEATLFLTGQFAPPSDMTLPSYLLATPSDNDSNNETAGFYLVKNGVTRSQFLTNPALWNFQPDVSFTFGTSGWGHFSPIMVLSDSSEFYIGYDELPKAEINNVSYYGFEFLKDETWQWRPTRNIANGQYSLVAYYNPFASYQYDNCDVNFGGIYLGTTGVISTTSTSATLTLTDTLKKPKITFTLTK